MMDQAQAIALVVVGLAALLGIGAAAVGMFVLRVEFVQERREREMLQKRVTELEQSRAER